MVIVGVLNLIPVAIEWIEEQTEKSAQPKRQYNVSASHEVENEGTFFIRAGSKYTNSETVYFRTSKSFPSGSDFIVYIIDDNGNKIPISGRLIQKNESNYIKIHASKFPKKSSPHKVFITARNAQTGEIETSNVIEIEIVDVR